MRYVDEFLRCKCADMMVRLGLFPNAKEVYTQGLKHIKDKWAA